MWVLVQFYHEIWLCYRDNSVFLIFLMLHWLVSSITEATLIKIISPFTINNSTVVDMEANVQLISPKIILCLFIDFVV